MDTPQEVKDAIVPGGLYKVKLGVWPMGHNGLWTNDQAYNLAVPVHDENGDIWMQDTYQIKYYECKKGLSRTDSAILYMINLCSEDYKGWVVRQAKGDFYFKNQKKLTSLSDLDGFILLGDLHDYRGLKSGEDERDYEKKDLLHHVKLYKEHGFSWTYGDIGVTLVRKNAVPNSALALKAKIRDVYNSFYYPDGASYLYLSYIDEYEEKCKSNGTLTDELKNELFVVRSLNEKLNEMRKEFNKYRTELESKYLG